MIPTMGRIRIVDGQVARSVDDVTKAWSRTRFLQDRSIKARGWLSDVLLCVERIGTNEFTLSDVYAFEDSLAQTYPSNRNIRPKIRQQLQVLRDADLIEFIGQGRYRFR